MPLERFSNPVKIISLNRNELIARLRDIANLLKEEHPIVKDVCLFGSLARGDQTGISDIDVLIVLKHTQEKSPHRRALTLLPYFDLNRGTDLLVLTHDELEHKLDSSNWLSKKVWGESISLTS